MKQNSESERRSPSSEDEKEENESAAEIRNADDYHEIFQPRNAICGSPPQNHESLLDGCTVPDGGRESDVFFNFPSSALAPQGRGPVPCSDGRR